MITKRELLEACARATGRAGYVYHQDADWNPIDSSHDTFNMAAQMRVGIEWREHSVNAGRTMFDRWKEPFSHHVTPEAAARWAVCRAVAAGEKS